MPVTDAFFDTNVLVYLIASDPDKAARAESLIAKGGTISVQVLNEFAHVVRRKHALDWHDLREVLGIFRSLFTVVPLSVDIHDRGLAVAEATGYGLYDSMIIAAAEAAGATVLYSEDMQDGHRIGNLEIHNPFRS